MSIKVFAADGRYLRSVGRRGQGPMGFDYAQPVQVDSAGVVHVFDVGNARETLIGPDFGYGGDRAAPVGFSDISALPGSDHHYVISRWEATAKQLAFLLHVISGLETIASFGVVPQADGFDITQAGSSPRVAVGPTGIIFSSKFDHYVIEAWTTSGSRIAGFEMPGLNPQPVRPGVWATDNPPPNLINAIAASEADHLWVVSWRRRPNWRDLTVERVMSGGIPYLDPKDGQVASVYRSRVDLIDLNRSTIVASIWQDGLALRFIAPDLLLKLDYDEGRSAFLRVFEVTVDHRQ